MQQIKHQQNKLARRIMEMVRGLSLEDFLKFHQEDSNNSCKHCNKNAKNNEDSVTDEDATVPTEPPIPTDPNFGRHRRKHH